MVGVTAGSASATAPSTKTMGMGPVFLNLHDLNPQEKTFVLSIAQKDLKKFGVQKASIKSVSGG